MVAVSLPFGFWVESFLFCLLKDAPDVQSQPFSQTNTSYLGCETSFQCKEFLSSRVSLESPLKVVCSRDRRVMSYRSDEKPTEYLLETFCGSWRWRYQIAVCRTEVCIVSENLVNRGGSLVGWVQVSDPDHRDRSAGNELWLSLAWL